MEKVPKNPQRDNTSLPDLAYIRQNIPIEKVWNELADEVGLEPVKNHAARCFRPEAHQNGDRTPSFHFAKNNKCACRVCDSRYFSGLDLVQRVLKCTLPEAIRWFTCHWDIPSARPGRPAGLNKPARPYRIGRGGRLEQIVRSGLFGEMSWPGAKLLVVLTEVQDEDGEVDWSFRSLSRAAGIVSDHTIGDAIKELRRLHILAVRKEIRPGDRNSHNVYRLTLDHPELAKLIDSTYRANFFANSEERRLRAEMRKNRDHHAKTNQ